MKKLTLYGTIKDDRKGIEFIGNEGWDFGICRSDPAGSLFWQFFANSKKVKITISEMES